jgi:hypothetical protein
MKSKKYEAPKYEHPIYDINWTAGAGQPAGMYWVEGRILMAAHGSAAEDALLRLGGILVASLIYSPDPIESVHRHGVVHPLDAAQAAETLLNTGVN